jgi:uncharacterized protein
MAVFADTSFFIALLSRRDPLHARASAMLGEVRGMVTTAWILAELADGMYRPGERERCAAFIQGLRNDPALRLLEPESEIYWRGFELYRSREDKEWSLTDCISFLVMSDLGLTEALTADHHFEQAGFTALLRR